MPRVLRTTRARTDLLEIWHYIKDHSGENRADSVLRFLDQKCATLAASPNIGRRRNELQPNLRSFAAGRYLILYRPVDGGIELVRVLHGARDITALFQPWS